MSNIIFYLPILAGPYSAEDPRDWMQENALYIERAVLAEDIRGGHIDPPPVRILEINETAKTVSDITRDIAIDVGDASFGDRAEPFKELREWLEKHDAGYYNQQCDRDYYDQRREHSTLCRQMQLGWVALFLVSVACIPLIDRVML